MNETFTHDIKCQQLSEQLKGQAIDWLVNKLLPGYSPFKATIKEKPSIIDFIWLFWKCGKEEARANSQATGKKLRSYRQTQLGDWVREAYDSGWWAESFEQALKQLHW